MIDENDTLAMTISADQICEYQYCHEHLASSVISFRHIFRPPLCNFPHTSPSPIHLRVVLHLVEYVDPLFVLPRPQQRPHVVPVEVVVLLYLAEAEGQLAHPVNAAAHPGCKGERIVEQV